MQPLNREHKEAIALRQKGLSYSEIQKIIPVSQASLSLWLRNIKITDNQQKRLRVLAVKGQKDGASARHKQRLDDIEKLREKVASTITVLRKDPFFTFGLALYWAEGSKQKEWNVSARVAFANSDPVLVVLIRSWFVRFFNVNQEDFQYTLFIHDTVDTEKPIKQWIKILGIIPDDIAVVFKHNVIRGRHKQKSYKGLIRLAVRKSTTLNRLIGVYQEALAKELLKR